MPTVSRDGMSIVFLRVVCLALLGGLFLSTGCSSVGWGLGRHVPLYKQSYFSVQMLVPEAVEDEAVAVDSLLLSAPVGQLSANGIDMLHSAVRQELQQVLPGSIRTPRRDGDYARYAVESNLFLEDGRVSLDEVVKMGRLAKVSHVIVVRVLDHRPYHPQRLVMDWFLIDVDKQRLILVLSGGLDVAEHKTEQLAKDYYRARKADSGVEAGFDVMLRSPREYARFTVAQAVNGLRGRVHPASRVLRP